jgi:hypothetical protein
MRSTFHGFLAPALVSAALLALPCALASAPARAGGGGPTAGLCGVPPGDPACGDPTTIGTGNVFETATDYETAAPNKLTLKCYYNTLLPGTDNRSPVFAN